MQHGLGHHLPVELCSSPRRRWSRSRLFAGAGGGSIAACGSGVGGSVRVHADLCEGCGCGGETCRRPAASVRTWACDGGRFGAGAREEHVERGEAGTEA
jgi:hypothetical protein